MKIVINSCFGGFGLSNKAKHMYRELSGITDPEFIENDIKRNDPILVEVVEKLDEEANGLFARLEVFEIPDGLTFEINEYDGLEDFTTYLEVGILDLTNGFSDEQLLLAQKASYIKLI